MAKCQNPDCDYFQKPIPDGDFCPFCGETVQLRTQLAVTQLAVTLPSSERVEMEMEGVEIEGVEMEPIHLEDLTQDPIPGEIILAETPILANVGRRTLILEVTNTGDRPVQVGSHYHFFEVNRGLLFDRADSFGMRLNIPSGNAVRFEPGQTQRVTLVELSGKGVVYGFNSLTQGSTRTRAQHLKALQSYQNWQEESIAPEVIV